MGIRSGFGGIKLIGVFLRSVGKFASALYLTGLALIMARAPIRIVPDGLFHYELLLVCGLALFQFGLFGWEVVGVFKK
jgi:hypothetical protein